MNCAGMTTDQIEARWPRLIHAMQYAAILSHSEAACALRDLHDLPRHGGGEAVAHYGGPLAVLQGALRCRAFVRTHYPLRRCRQCRRLTTAGCALCSQGCASAWFDGPGSRR